MTRRQLNRATLTRQMLLTREAVDVVTAVGRLAGMQAQEAKPPFLGLWTRLDGFEREELHAALHDRSLVRTTWLRGTLHLVTANDFVDMRAALEPVTTQALKVLGDRAKGLDLDKVLPVARKLFGTKPHNFNELRGLLQEEFPDVNERALGYTARMYIPLVMVPTKDRWAFPSVAEFTLADAWLGRELSEDSTPDALVMRYLAAFGPATASDVQTWSGLGGMKPVLERLRPHLWTDRDERKRELFDLPDAPRPDPDTPAPIRFLPEFDNLVLSHTDRSRIIAEEHRGKVVTKNLRVRATFLVDGFVAGTYTVERKRDTATAVLTPFEKLSRPVTKDLTMEAVNLLKFAEPDATTFDVKFEADAVA